MKRDKSGRFVKSKSKGGGKSATKRKLSMDKIYFLTYKGAKIPYQFTRKFETIILGVMDMGKFKQLKDYPDQVNTILRKKYPKLKSVQHHSHYTEFIKKKSRR